MTTNFSSLFRALAGTDFILIGGLAAAVHGAARATYDVDVLYARTAENIGRLVDTEIVSAFGIECRCLTLERLARRDSSYAGAAKLASAAASVS